MNYVENVAAHLRDLVDEPDTSYLTRGIVARFLEQGYREFRRKVSALDPTIFATGALVPMVDQNHYDLDAGPEVILLGSMATTQLDRIISIAYLPSSGIPGPYWSHVPSRELLQGSGRANLYTLQRAKLVFSCKVTGNLLLTYEPAPNVSWAAAAQTTGASEWIDDLVGFHDLIALYAAAKYMAMEGAPNQLILMMTQQREADLAEYITHRGHAGPHFVTDNGEW